MTRRFTHWRALNDLSPEERLARKQQHTAPLGPPPKDLARGMGAVKPQHLIPEDHHVAARLRQRRILCGLNQHQIAAEIGVTHSAYAKWERVEQRIPASRLPALCRALNVPVRYFYQEMDPETFAPIPSPRTDIIDAEAFRHLRVLHTLDRPTRDLIYKVLLALGHRSRKKDPRDTFNRRRKKEDDE